MNQPPLCLAVTGLHRGEKPQPAAGIIRSLPRRFPNAHNAGLCYDAMESGIYAEGGPDEVHLMPYPAAGRAALLDRIDVIRPRPRFELLIPTLDSEREVFANLPHAVKQRGIDSVLPRQKSEDYVEQKKGEPIFKILSHD